LLPGSRLPFVDNILFITFVPNYRGFSWFVPELPDGFRLLFLVLRLTILTMAFPVYDFYSQSEKAGKWAWIALVAISAGVAGNLLDDVFVTYTTDFIQVFQSPSANLADLFSYTGIGALAIEFSVQWKRKKPHWHGFRHCLAYMVRVRRDFLVFMKGYFVRKQ